MASSLDAIPTLTTEAAQRQKTPAEFVVPARHFRGSDGARRRLGLHYGLIAEFRGYSSRCLQQPPGVYVFKLWISREELAQAKALFAEALGEDGYLVAISP